MIPVARGDGAWLVGHDGRRYLDAISSWWTNLFGHANPRIAAAIKEPARSPRTRASIAGFTHEPAIELAEELLRVAPGRSSKVPVGGHGGERGRGQDAQVPRRPWMADERPPGRSPSASVAHGWAE
jgi:adenosylmethionine-8-amino-7-oxononanoate aminotransferase